MSKTYSKKEVAALVAEFSRDFDELVKNEVAKAGQALKKSEDGSDEKEAPPADSGSSEGAESAPAESAPAESAPAADSAPDASASAPAPAADPAAAGAPADPAAQAAGTDPMQALSQAYAQLSPEELQQHFQALKQVLMAQGGAAGADPMAAGAPPAPGADPMAAAMGGALAGAPPAAAPEASLPPAGPNAVAPLAGEGSKPVDPAATMALKSESGKDDLVKAERAKVAELEKAVEQLTAALSKAVSQPVRKGITGLTAGDLIKSEPAQADVSGLSKNEVTKRLMVAAKKENLSKSDRDLINNYYKGAVKVDALAHLLG